VSPLVSVVTVCRNDFGGLLRTYESLRLQDRALFEWIIVDGASNDATKGFLESLGPDDARWVSEPDGGIYDAMNKGIRLSKGGYCVFMNSGDEFWANDTLTKVALSLDGLRDIVYGDAVEISGADQSYKQAFPAKNYWYSMFTHHQSIFYKRASLADGYDLSFKLAADWALTSRLIMKGANSYYIAEPISRFHRGGSSDRPQLRALADRELWRVYREVHRRGLAVSSALYALKRAMNVLRFSAKPIYARLRMMRASPTTGEK
jgi:putative colanic acid biosynthesis glycosyltransferase